MNNSTLHQLIISFFLRHERAPSVVEIAQHFRCDVVDARRRLRLLADDHGVVLHPTSEEIWIAHPFSAAPTTCVVRSGTRKWWGNCVWCSLGLAHLAGGASTIETRIGALHDHAVIRIENDHLLDTDYVVHFPIPMQKAWENVIYTCSVMLLFRNHAQVQEWCDLRGIPEGDVIPLSQVWPFAKEWYGRHAAAEWEKWSVAEAADIFRRHGLTGPIWSLADAPDRF